MRVHWATFDAADKGGGEDAGHYNQNNCQTAADVLNANVRRLNGGNLPAKFWCERGTFKR